MTWNTKTSYDDLADKYKREKFLIENSPKEFALELDNLALTLVDYTNFKHRKFGNLPLLFPSQFLGSVQHYPLLLAGSKLANQETFERFYQQVAARTTWYVLAKERPPEFEAMIPKWSNAVREAGPDTSLNELDAIYKTFAFGESMDGKYEMLTSELAAKVKAWRYSESSGKKKIRASLALCSWWLDQMCDKPFEIQDYFSTKKLRGQKGWDLDHIFAKKYENDSVPAELRDSIGNLALLSPADHRPSGNASPSDKTDIYAHSTLVLSKSVLGVSLTPLMDAALAKIYAATEIEPTWKLETWGVDAIESRTEFLSAFLTKIVRMEIEPPAKIKL